ncbi:TetR/AcrR family transcriptional regulator [Companilactobacillus mishanensis]|uniref:TetR/AcrR family transcriptional regulator n=1 Tax=Companilactobacillus mishanensis TaxID=2486008 RepID=UPI0015626E07|nr:TetR/AcrR family transcriptional regulator [Companilactobacillus mishanensis]
MTRDTSAHSVTRMQKQTKIWIKDALFELLGTYSFEDITVKQLVLTAEISRPTFYRLYPSKNEVLSDAVQDILDKYKGEINKKSPQNFEELTSICFEYFYINHDHLKVLIDSNLTSYLSNSFTKEFMNEVSSNPASWRQWTTPLQKTIGVNFAFGGMLNVLLNWISTDCRVSPEDMKNQIIIVIDNLHDKNNDEI